jgi:predicted porin
VGEGIDQTNMDGLDSAVGAVDTSLVGAFWIDSTEDAIEFGGVIALDIDYASNFESSLNDQGSSTVLNEAWIYADSPWGRLQLGQQDGVARVMGMRPPSVSGSVRVDNPEVYLLAYPCAIHCDRDNPQFPGSIFSPNGMQLRSDIHSSDVWMKVAYYTPRISGFQFGVSYTPTGSRSLGEFFSGNDDDRNEQINIWEFGLNYLGSIGDVDVGASAGYLRGNNANNDSLGFFDDVWDYGAGINVAYREWSAGVSYRRTNVAGGGPVLHGNFVSNVLDGLETEIWSAGVKYETGPWSFGLDYITENEQQPNFPRGDQNGKGFEAAVGYTFNEWLRMTGGYQRFEFDGPVGQCQTDHGGGFIFPPCDTQDANVGFVETKFSF